MCLEMDHVQDNRIQHLHTEQRLHGNSEETVQFKGRLPRFLQHVRRVHV